MDWTEVETSMGMDFCCYFGEMAAVVGCNADSLVDWLADGFVTAMFVVGLTVAAAVAVLVEGNVF